MLPGSRNQLWLTLRQLRWGMASAALTVIVVAPLLGDELGLIAASHVALATVAALELDHRRKVRRRLQVTDLGPLQTLAATAGASALLTFGSATLLHAALGLAGAGAGLAAAATVASILVLRQGAALFSPRHRLIEIS